MKYEMIQNIGQIRSIVEYEKENEYQIHRISANAETDSNF